MASATATKKILLGKYEVGKVLGRGATSKVYHARDTRTGQSVALKCLNKRNIQYKDLISCIIREVEVMRRLRHAHIVRLFEVLATRDHIYFVMELVEGGDLFTLLDAKGRLPEDVARRYFQQLISAIRFCHLRGIYHRDLKPENILIDENGNLKVSDFGLSAVSNQRRHDGLFHTLCGTPAYVAPEILCRKGYDGAKVDIWSAGVILFAIASGYLPFNDSNVMVMYRKIYRGEFRCPKWMSEELQHLVSRLLDPSPTTRISMDDILNDPWFQKDLDIDQFDKFDHEEAKKDEEMEDRELNAFDLISFSTGFNLRGLFDPVPTVNRFTSREKGEVILGRIEKLWSEKGLVVRREGEKGNKLEVNCRTGILTVKVEVLRLNRDMVVVETRFYDPVWEEKLKPGLKAFASEPGVEGNA